MNERGFWNARKKEIIRDFEIKENKTKYLKAGKSQKS